MTRAEQVSHLCKMIRANTEHCWLSNIAAQFGYLDRLNELALSGAFASSDTTEARWLTDSADDLRKLADQIEATRARLTGNIKDRK